MTGRQGKRCKKQLDDIAEKRIYCVLKEEALVRSVESVYGRGCGPVVRHATE